MATGRRAFQAPTQASLIAKILETEPPVVSTLAPLAPPALDHVVQGCLAKAPVDRWQSAHDVKMQLQWVQRAGASAAAATVSPPRSAWLPWVVVAIAVVGLVRQHPAPVSHSAIASDGPRPIRDNVLGRPA